ncbi:MAG: hypothetical protein ABFS56_26030, partial [Pseudomonadota bacterium]
IHPTLAAQVYYGEIDQQFRNFVKKALQQFMSDRTLSAIQSKIQKSATVEEKAKAERKTAKADLNFSPRDVNQGGNTQKRGYPHSLF